jgi:hypothetical protein
MVMMAVTGLGGRMSVVMMMMVARLSHRMSMVMGLMVMGRGF